MPPIVKALGWAAAIILIAIGSRMGFYSENVADVLMMATLVTWVSIGFPRSCAGRTVSGN